MATSITSSQVQETQTTLKKPQATSVLHINKELVPKRQGTVKIKASHTPLIRAIFDNDIESFRTVIKRNPEYINTPEPNYNYSPILLAAETKNVELGEYFVKTLVEHGANPKVMTKNGQSLLTKAAAFNPRLVEYCINQGEDVNQPYASFPPVVLAAEKGQIETLRLLTSFGADLMARVTGNFKNVGVTAIHQAATKGQLESVRYIVETLREKGVDVVNSVLNDNNNHFKVTPLALACEAGHTHIVQYLIENGANVNIHRFDNWTSLHVVAKSGNVYIAQLLLAAGIDRNAVFRGTTNSNAQRSLNITAVYIAKKYSHFHIARMIDPYCLSASNANLPNNNNNNYNALESACSIM